MPKRGSSFLVSRGFFATGAICMFSWESVLAGWSFHDVHGSTTCHVQAFTLEGIILKPFLSIFGGSLPVLAIMMPFELSLVLRRLVAISALKVS